MGNCYTKPKFDLLKYPSYCPNVPAIYEDHIRCLEVWTYAARTRVMALDGTTEKSFQIILRSFNESLAEQFVMTPLPPDFLIFLVSTLINGRHMERARVFREYNITEWSAIGTALLIAIKSAYSPKLWSADIKQTWLRCYGALLREVLTTGTVNTELMSASIKVPGVTPSSYSPNYVNPFLSPSEPVAPNNTHMEPRKHKRATSNIYNLSIVT